MNPNLDLDRAAVVGAGTAGRGICRALAAAGVEVRMVERTDATLQRAQEALREGLERDLGRWAVTESERDAILARIEGTTSLDAVRGVPIVFEAIPEDEKDKRILLREIDGIADSTTIFCLNTSTLSITALSDGLSSERRPLVIGMHFLHPVSRIPLVELVRGRHTGERAESFARAVADRLEKEVMEVAEYPGYVTTRLTLTLINEAVHLVMEGVATRDAVDRAMKLRLGARHGPLALADEIGLDSVYRALDSLWRELGLSQFRPAPLLRRMVNAGWLGEKSGRGFYRYDETGRRLPVSEDLGKPPLDRLLPEG
ncbi:MAG: 3-hydroxyacyl-CoA dehydrogenase family protein [Gemmatimonadales bacterium]|nr:MAG: 3-hydroxyacyl-CoA dehydrogenase family protein [Gemmatimonadales bacterium]